METQVDPPFDGSTPNTPERDPFAFSLPSTLSKLLSGRKDSDSEEEEETFLETGSIKLDLKKMKEAYYAAGSKPKVKRDLFFNLEALLYYLAYDRMTKEPTTNTAGVQCGVKAFVDALLEVLPQQERWIHDLFRPISSNSMTIDEDCSWPEGFVELLESEWSDLAKLKKPKPVGEYILESAKETRSYITGYCNPKWKHKSGFSPSALLLEVRKKLHYEFRCTQIHETAKRNFLLKNPKGKKKESETPEDAAKRYCEENIKQITFETDWYPKAWLCFVFCSDPAKIEKRVNISSNSEVKKNTISRSTQRLEKRLAAYPNLTVEDVEDDYEVEQQKKKKSRSESSSSLSDVSSNSAIMHQFPEGYVSSMVTLAAYKSEHMKKSSELKDTVVKNQLKDAMAVAKEALEIVKNQLASEDTTEDEKKPLREERKKHENRIKALNEKLFLTIVGDMEI
jgi:hypothetical protein